VAILFSVITSVAATRIYREDSHRVAASRNLIGLSLLKCIRHRLVAKINGKKKPRTCEALDRISVDYSRAHRAPVPIAPPGEARQARACVSPFLISFTHLQVHREQNSLYK
jgi:hypothetical protein